MSSPKPRILFFGTPQFAVPVLSALISNSEWNVGAVITQQDKPAGRGRELKASPVKLLAEENKIPVLQPKSLKKETEHWITEISRFGPFDIGVVIAFGQILPQAILDLPVHGCVNVHASILPRWRGAAPIQRAIMAGDPETGVGLMAMEAGLDTGPVFVSERIPIAPSDNGGSLHDKLSSLGAELISRHLKRIIKGEVRAERQSDDGVTYAEKITAADLLLDWSRPAIEIERRVRALSPFPAAYTFLEGKRFKITAAAVCNGSQSEPPGTITQVTKDWIDVQCGEGRLKLLEVQIEGKKRVSAAEFLRGAHIMEGVKLGTA